MSDSVLRYPRRPAKSRVRLAPGGLAALGAFARSLTHAPRAVVVTDTQVAALYGTLAIASLRRARIAAELIVVPAGERSKRGATLLKLWEQLAACGVSRQDLIVALGGGVVGDLAGFAAATWLRGVDWLGVPTTLLAQVDSSVGGKTGIDLAAGKNLAGAFHQPVGVLVDPRVLVTLPGRERRAGLAEVVKIGMACDARLFAWVERNAEALAAGETRATAEAVRRAILAKARIVVRDEFERSGRRSALNFGHTLGHAIEAALSYRGIRHGEAVAIGMRAAAALSIPAGLAPESRSRLERVLDQLGLPRRMPATKLEALRSAMRSDKKRGSSGVRWVLTPQIGHASVPRSLPDRRVRDVLIALGARA